MPPRDSEDYEAKRQRIIDGALQVFSRKGFEKATNREIAEAAGIGSPGLIYHYFKDKADLLHEVVLQRAPVLQLVERPEQFMALPPREALTLFGSLFVQTFENTQAASMFKLVVGEAVRRPSVAEMFTSIGPARGLVALTSYVQEQMDRGNLRRMNAGAAARTFVGPFVLYGLTKDLFVLPAPLQIPPEQVVETAVEIFLRGMEPGQDDKPTPESQVGVQS